MEKNMERVFDIKLFFILLFLGWFGIDKLYKKDWKMCLVKIGFMLLAIGIIWNIYDIVMCCMKRYQTNPLKD